MRLLSILLVSTSVFIGSCASTQNSQVQERAVPDNHTTNWAPVEGHAMTRWAKDVSPDNVLPEYPRPQMVRDNWKNLNGLWQYAMAEDRTTPPFGEELEDQILVPFAIESALSGVKKRADSLWYRHTFDLPQDWKDQRVLLHFGAVDWESTVFVNGEEVGTHRGGYDAFSFDISKHLNEEGTQELVVKVFDPSDDGDQPRGKQVKNPRGIWYTPVTGIWQTVWLEPVPSTHIANLRLTPDVDNEQLNISVESNGSDVDEVRVIGYDGDEKVGQTSGSVGEEFSLNVPDPKLWTPDNPHLYDLKVQLVNNGTVVDEVESYFGMRKIELGKDEDGKTRILLNDEFVFQLGPLDQGYWPDGLYTAPTDEALRYDLEITKKLGFNMNRKHVKVEPERWYYWADRLGVLVWQDMVTGSNTTPESKEQYEVELREMVQQFYNYPSIVNWVVFNEGWGQFDTKRITEQVEEWDPSRIITDASGWQHYSVGDIIDVHRYPGPAAIKPASDRASVVGEFGGVGFIINGHNWAGDEGWGYQNIIRKPEEYINRYEDLIHRLYWMGEEYGMSGGVYTQITDVETELNGMLTYDREVIKAAAQQFAAANKGITPYIWPSERTFTDQVEVKLYNWEEDTEIRYTLDGSDPDTSSMVYDGPFALAESTQVRARTFKNNAPIGYESDAQFEKVAGREAEFATPDNLKPGLRYAYYESPSKDEPRYRRHWPLRRQVAGANQVLEPVSTGTISNFDLAPHEQEELFAVEFEGYIEIPEDGVYTFYISADDDAKMYIGGEQIFDRMGQSPDMAHDLARVPLKAGIHPIEVKYFQAYGPFGLKVSYEGPGVDRQPIADEQLYHSESK